ncbi:g5099 [Coccomyxa elongata]
MEPFPEPSKDFWEGEQWELVGKLFIAFVPLLIAFGVGVGVFAAATYNEGVDAYVKPASETAPAEVVPAQPPVAAAVSQVSDSAVAAPPVADEPASAASN